MLTLRPYQNEAADFIYEHDRAMVLAPVGAGKTAITLTAMKDALNDGVVKRWFGDAYKTWPVEWSKVFETVPSTQAYEDYVGVSQRGMAQFKTEGQPLKYDSPRQGFASRIQNMTFALGDVITYEEMQDNQWGPKGVKKAQSLARAFHYTDENIHALVLSRAFTAGYTGGDGATVCSTAHPNKRDNATWSNRLAVDTALSEDSLETMVIPILTAEDDAGNAIQLMPKDLVIAPANVFNAQRILKSINQSGTANKPIQHWAQGAANVAQALMGGYDMRQIDQQERAAREEVDEGLGRVSERVATHDDALGTLDWQLVALRKRVEVLGKVWSGPVYQITKSGRIEAQLVDGVWRPIPWDGARKVEPDDDGA